ncbi:MAG: hypothetical protein RI958_161 [Actinomycetota bacterium]
MLRTTVRHHLALVAVMTGLATVAVVGAPISEPTVSAVTGGRVQPLGGEFRVYDSRIDPGSDPQGQTTTFRFSGLARIFVAYAAASGEGFIHPCDGVPGTNPNFGYRAGTTTAYTAVGQDSCVRLTSPAVVVVDQIAVVSDTPTADGLQYQPLATPQKLFEAATSVDVDGTALVPLADVPLTAQSAVVLVEVPNPSRTGYAQVLATETTSPSGGPRCGRPQTSAVTFAPGDRSAALAYIPVDPDRPALCAFSSDPESITRLTLVGYLVTDGADDTRLPPTMLTTEQLTDPPGLQSFTPQRLLDTRDASDLTGGVPIKSGSYLELTIPQATGYSASAVLNVTVVEPTLGGFLTVYPCDAPLPEVSNLNYVPGDVVPNLVNVKISVTRTVCFYAQRTTHLVVDISGTFERAGGAGVEPIVPTRLLDTREAIGIPTTQRLAAGRTVRLQVAGADPKIPDTGVAAATMNVTVDGPVGAGFVTVYPCDQPLPTVSNLNFVPNDTVPNLVTVRLSADGAACFYVSAGTHLIADITAWYRDDQPDGFTPLVPERFLDTRTGLGTSGAGKVPGGRVLKLQVAGRGLVPSDTATGAAVNVTVVEPDGPGFVTVYPCDAPTIPETSNLNFVAGDIVPNLVFSKLAGDGTLCLYTTTRTDLLVDVAGYFTQTDEVVRAPRLVP